MRTEDSAQLAVFQCYSWSSWQIFLRESQEFCCVCFNETFLFFLTQTVKVAAACGSYAKSCVENEKKCHKIAEWSLSFHNEFHRKNNRVCEGGRPIIQFRKKNVMALSVGIMEMECGQGLYQLSSIYKKWHCFRPDTNKVEARNYKVKVSKDRIFK